MYITGASFIYVLLKSTQQLNVVHHKYIWVIPISYGMAACEVFLFGTIAITAVNELDKYMLVVQIGSGGGLGAIVGMFIHGVARNRGGSNGVRDESVVTVEQDVPPMVQASRHCH